MRWFAAVAIASLVVGCHSAAPPAPTVDAFYSQCGHPGDTGNALGIGKFCNSIDDCAGMTSAPLCSILGSSTTHFCTTTCPSMGSNAACGTGAQCVCNAGNQCGCTPNVCLGM